MPLADVRRLHDVVAKAGETASAIGDRTRLGRVMGVTAQNWWYAGLPERAVKIAEEAVTVAGDAGDELGLIAAHFYLGVACHLHGDFARAVDALKWTAERAKIEFEGSRLHSLRWRSINSLLWLGWALAELGDFPAALGVGEEAVRLSERYGTRDVSQSGKTRSQMCPQRPS